MLITRRDFLKLATAATASAVVAQYKLEIQQIFAQAKDYVHICWLNAAACTGCSVSLAQAADPDLLEVLTSITVGNSGLPIALPDWLYVLHPASGGLGVELINDWMKLPKTKNKILVIEGSLQSEGYAEMGGRDLRDWITDGAKVADVIIAYGTCSTFGGIPHAKGNVTGAMGAQDFLKQVGMPDQAAKVINLSRCPGHPDSLVLLLASLIQGITPELDQYNRPLAFFGKNIHEEACPFRPFYDKGVFAKYGQSEEGCRFKIGCKGPVTWADCPTNKWNDHTAFCIEDGICYGCAEPLWPDGEHAPFFTELPSLPTILNIPVNVWGAAFLGAGAGAIAIHAARRVFSKKQEVKEVK